MYKNKIKKKKKLFIQTGYKTLKSSDGIKLISMP